MDIRALEENDLPALLELYRHLHRADDPAPGRDVLERIWKEIVDSGRFVHFGGFVEGRLVASCALTVVPNLTRGGRPYGLIENVVTHAAHRRRGYGTALLHAALSHAWANRCYKVMLLTGRKDAATLRFYRSAGFDPDDKQAFVARPAD